MHIVWSYGYTSRLEIWLVDSAATVHVSPNPADFTTYHKYDKSRSVNTFSNNTVEAVGEGDIVANIKCRGKNTRIRLTQVMHKPKAEGRILSLKVLDRKGYKTRVAGGCIRIMRNGKTCAEAFLGRQLYEVKMKILRLQETVKDEPLGLEPPTQESRNTDRTMEHKAKELGRSQKMTEEVSDEVLIMKITHRKPGICLSEEEEENLEENRINQPTEEDTNIIHRTYTHGTYVQDKAACQDTTSDGQIETIREIISHLE